MQCKILVRNRLLFPRKLAQENGWINSVQKWRNLLPQKDFTLSSNWYKYLSSAPIIWAPTPGNLAPSKKSPNPERLPFAAPGSSTEYIHAKLCFSSGRETLKYQPSKNRRLVPSKWYLWNETIRDGALMIKNAIQTLLQQFTSYYDLQHTRTKQSESLHELFTPIVNPTLKFNIGAKLCESCTY